MHDENAKIAAPPAASARWLAGIRPYLLLTLLCAVLFLPGLATIPPTDRDESRFMQATKQMLETGNFIDIRFQDEPRNKKPVGIYWLQALAVGASGVTDLGTAWPYRVPSALAAWLAVLITCGAGGRLFGPHAGVMAGAVLATCLLVVAEAHLAKTDAALLAASALAFAGMARLYMSQPDQIPPSAVLMFWLALGAGILLKGPIIVLVMSAAVAALCVADRDLGWLHKLRPAYGLPLAAVLVLPWLVAMSITGQSNFIDDTLRQDIWPKLVGGQETHGAPPGTHLLSALATAWPWSALAPFVLLAAWRRRHVPAVRLCLAWLIPGWLVFELVPTKLPHYTLPLFPAFALLTAAALGDMSQIRSWIAGRAGRITRGAFLLVAVGLGGIIITLGMRYGDGVSAGGVIAALAATGAGLFIAFGLGRSGATTIAASLTAASTVLVLALTWGVVPRLTTLALTARVAAAVERHGGGQGVVAFGGFHEPSAIFLLGTRTILTDVPSAATHLLSSPAALAVIPVENLPVAEATLQAAGRLVLQLEVIAGYNYSRGSRVHLTLLQVAPDSAGPGDRQ